MGIPSPEQLQKLAAIIHRELSIRAAASPPPVQQPFKLSAPAPKLGAWDRFKQSAQSTAQDIRNAAQSPISSGARAAQAAKERLESKAASTKLTFKQTYPMLLKQLVPIVAQSALAQGIQSAAGVTGGLAVKAGTAYGFTIGTSIAPIGAAVTPWIAAATVATQAGTIFGLHDLKEAAVSHGQSKNVNYICSCGRCAENLDYIIEKSERNAGLVAIGVATLGVSAVIKQAHSIGKYVYSKAAGEVRPKEIVSRTIVGSAKDGCTVAMATVFLLSGSWTMIGPREANTMATAVAIIITDDGWEYFKGKW